MNNSIRDRGNGKIGVVVPVSNSNLEPDMVLLRPPGVSVHFMRAGGYDLDEIPDSQQMVQFAEASLDEVLRDLCAVRPDVLVYGCTSATLAKGPDFDQEFCLRMGTLTGLPSITAAGALCEALRDMGINKLAFTSPYTEQLNQEGADFLSAAGFNIVSTTYIGEDLGNYGQSDLQPAQVMELGLRADHPEAEAIVLSCTDMRAVEVIEELEQQTGKLVVTSNQALMHSACKRLGITSTAPGRLGQ